MRYTPFERPLRELTLEDLAVLRSVAEGWYVEYKREVPARAERIARSIASFANQYGGWLFYGVAEHCDANQNNAFPGVEAATWPDLNKRIAAAVKDCISPSPHIDVRCISGPSQVLGLDAGKAIIVIRVPMGQDTPYVHKSGKIYRRVADQSDAIAETDRTALDLLFQRRKAAIDRLEALLSYEPEISEGESKTPILVSFFLPDPLGDQSLRTSVTLDEFTGIMRPSQHRSLDIDFNFVHSTHNGFVGRHVQTQSARALAPTFHHHLDGTSVVVFPLSSYDSDTYFDYVNKQNYDYIDDFLQSCRKYNDSSVQLIDLTLALVVLNVAYLKHFELLTAGGLDPVTFAAGTLLNAWRRTPFIDSSLYIDHINKFGLPFLQNDTVPFPFGHLPDALRSLEQPTGDAENAFSGAMPIWAELMYAAGLERLVRSGADAGFFEAALRAMEQHSAHEHRDPD